MYPVRFEKTAIVLNLFKCLKTIRLDDPEGFQSEANVLFAQPSQKSFTIGFKFSKFRHLLEGVLPKEILMPVLHVSVSQYLLKARHAHVCVYNYLADDTVA